MTINYLIRYIWAKKWLIIIPTVAAFLLAWFFTRALKPQYTSEAELSTGYMEVTPVQNAPASNINALFNNVVITLQSPQILDPVSYTLILHDLTEQDPFNGSVEKAALEKIMSNFSVKKDALIQSLSNKIDSSYTLNLSIKGDLLIREIANLYGYSPSDLMKDIQINRIEGTSFIHIISTTHDPRLSAFVANGICSQFLKLYQTKQGSSSAMSLNTLRTTMEAQKSRLDDKLNLLQGLDSRNINNPDQMIATLKTQLVLQRNNLISAQASLETLNDEISKSTQSGGGTAVNDEIITLRNNIDRLYSRYVNEGSSDPNLLAQIDNLRVLLQQKMSETNAVTSAVPTGDLRMQRVDLQTKINIATQTIKDLEDNIRSLEGTAKSSAVQQSMVDRLQGDVDIARQQYIQANNAYNDALNREKFPGNQFSQILTASPPLNPNPSTKIKVMGFATAGIFFALIFLFLFFEFVDPSVKTAGSLNAYLPVPVTASFQSLKRKKRSALQKPFENPEGNESVRNEFGIEGIKQVRFELQQSKKRTILVTSYQPGTGKTTVLQALADSLSLNHQKTLIIDANFQNNSLTRLYQPAGRIEDIALAPAENTDANKDMILKHITYLKDDKVGLIGCGSGNFTPSEVLPEGNIFDFLLKDKTGFEYVLIDCTSLEKGPGTKELLQYAEGVILVFSADQPLKDGDKNLIQFLKDNDVSVIGNVLNRVKPFVFKE